jgi:hypothetical protein
MPRKPTRTATAFDADEAEHRYELRPLPDDQLAARLEQTVGMGAVPVTPMRTALAVVAAERIRTLSAEAADMRRQRDEMTAIVCELVRRHTERRYLNVDAAGTTT